MKVYTFSFYCDFSYQRRWSSCSAYCSLTHIAGDWLKCYEFSSQYIQTISTSLSAQKRPKIYFFPHKNQTDAQIELVLFLFSQFMLLSSQWDGIINFVPFFKGENCFDFPIGNEDLHECPSLYGVVNLVLRNIFPCFDLTSGKGIRFPRFTSVPLKSESESCCFLELGDFSS